MMGLAGWLAEPKLSIEAAERIHVPHARHDRLSPSAECLCLSGQRFTRGEQQGSMPVWVEAVNPVDLELFRESADRDGPNRV
jgi:hypothetical protein